MLIVLFKPLGVVCEDILKNANDILPTFFVLCQERQFGDVIEHSKDILAIVHVHVFLDPSVEQLHHLREFGLLRQHCGQTFKTLQNIHVGLFRLVHLLPPAFFPSLSLSPASGDPLLVSRQVEALLPLAFLLQFPLDPSIFLDLLGLVVEVSVQLSFFATSPKKFVSSFTNLLHISLYHFKGLHDFLGLKFVLFGRISFVQLLGALSHLIQIARMFHLARWDAQNLVRIHGGC
mmetsp:Transcript_21092/g.46436  ORF Transcript_21092/g.46436 Transcript_21092/m.46436 type:complete len:233 (-) Transcript_21092:13-711(-)